MTEPRICPNCRARVPSDAPAGVCPACAMRAGCDSVSGPDARTRPAEADQGDTVFIEQLERALPELEQFDFIGQGGMGAVYRARHRSLQRPVAVKVLDGALRRNPAFAERFAREARTLAQLNHPNVVSVHDFGHRDGLYYLVMEFVDGVNLRHVMEAGELTPAQALAMVPRICDALQYAHDQGVVHRDIKPENILVDRRGAIKIADFGLAKLANESGRRLTQTRQVMGTPSYMAPEQIEHPEQVDHRADIFALGVVFYELLTGELPVGRFPPPSRRAQIDIRLDEVVLRTLEKEPRLRYQQASELRVDVETVTSSPHQAAARQPAEPDDYEYKSTRTVLGIPLIHIAHSRDPEGKRMRVARGIIAIGDMAIGAVAIGAFSFGGIAFGGISVRLVGFGGLAIGLLTVIAGIGLGGIAVGGLAVGLVARGAKPIAAFTLSDAALSQVVLAAWTLSTVGVTIAGIAAVYAWIASAQATRPDPLDDKSRT